MEKPDLKLCHVGINAADSEDAMKTVNLFCRLLGCEPVIQKKGSPYAGKYVEVCPAGKLGQHGHLAFKTEDLPATAKWMEENGIELDWSTAKYNADDNTCYLVYLKEQPAGFAIHLFGDKHQV